MTQPSSPSDSFAPLKSPPSASRVLAARAFRVLALGATLFGLAMLVIFFVRLGMDVRQWFRTTPPLVEKQNEELTRQLAEVRDIETFMQHRLKVVDDEKAAELARAKTEKQRDTIRKDYERFRERERANLEITAREVAQIEKDIRPNTSPGSLLWYFFSAGPSSTTQDAGIFPALLGSLYLALITILTAVPLGVGAAIYLEEYRSSGWLARIIQVNINNLAGVPSVMYGILGAFVFVDLIFKPLATMSPQVAARNVLGGGLTLALLTLPVIIVSAQEAIRAVPVSLRHAALALGATRWQTIRRVVLPSASPGILTGMILALCRALGEAAPLVMFGALLFVNQNPSLFSRFTVLPMQIFGWSDRPAQQWQYNAALASAVLVLALLALNGAAIYLRQRAQRHTRW